jgi:hypothetical protein
MSLKYTKALAITAALGASLAGEALAVALPLVPGGSTPLTPGTVGGTLLASLTDPFANLLYSGQVESRVYNDPAWASGLTFVYQVRLDPNVGPDLEDINRLTTFGWQSFTTSVEQDFAPGDGGTLADRSAGTGNTIGFNILPGFWEGETSALFIVRSDANGYKPGIGSVINGQSSNLDILAPDRRQTSVPDAGASALLLSLSLCGLAGVRRLAK